MSEPTARLSLYRRWRPQRFADVVGQDDVVRTLRNAVVAGDVAHAYLFAGERGIGKTSVARILSRAVNCLQPVDGEPCNKCPACIAVSSSRSLDIVEIDGASNRGIDHIRKLREEVNFAPTDLRVKVYIIDEVHMLTTEAFNALLKTLEEPPTHAMFIFATTEPHKLPRTIVSRCQAFEFRRQSVEAMEAQLKRIAEAEGVKLAAGAATLIARRANGGLRDAVVMLEQAATYDRDLISEEAVLEMLGLAPREAQTAFIDALERGDRLTLLATIEALAERGKDLEIFVSDVVGALRDRIAQGAETADRDVVLARGLLALRADLYRSLDRQIRLEIGALALASTIADGKASPASAKPQRPASSAASAARPQRPAPAAGRSPSAVGGTTTAPKDAVSAAVDHVPTAPSSGAAQATSRPDDKIASTGASTAGPSLSADALSQWGQLLGEVGKERIAVAAYMTEATPSVDGTRLVLSFHPEHVFHKESLEKTENMQYVAGAVRRCFGDAWRVDIRFDADAERKTLPHEALLEKARLVCRAVDGRIVKEES